MRQAHAALARRGILASNQVEYSLLHRRPETNGVLDACRSSGVTLIAYQPLASGALTASTPDQPAQWPAALRQALRGRDLAALEPITALLQQIGERYRKTLGRWPCAG